MTAGSATESARLHPAEGVRSYFLFFGRKIRFSQKSFLDDTRPPQILTDMATIARRISHLADAELVIRSR